MPISSRIFTRSIEDFEALIRCALRERMRRAEPSPEVKTVLLYTARLQQQRQMRPNEPEPGPQALYPDLPQTCPEGLSSEMSQARFFRRQVTM